MLERRIQPQQRRSSATTVGPRDSSPDSVIFTLDSNFSLFSSASASVDRCSFASDIHDQDSYASEISLNLTAHEGDFSHNESWNGPGSDPDQNKNGDATHIKSKKYNRLCRKGVKAKGHSYQKEDNDITDLEDGNQFLDSARSSFSLALKECQDRRASSEVLYRKQDRQRPASLDLNYASPRLGVVKKNSASSRLSGIFPSPGTPNYRQVGVAMQKGWSSERVTLHANASRKHLGVALLPLNNGRTLPSKWEDAERWIFSPVSGDGAMRTSVQPAQRKPKSKSGPLGPPGVAYHSLFSPAIPLFEGVNGKANFISDSPFSARTVTADTPTPHSRGHAAAFPSRIEPCMVRSVSVHGCTETQNQPSFPVSQDENSDVVKDAATNISRDVSRRDMATQMSPESSRCSSPNMRPSFSASTPSALPIVEVQSVSCSKMEIRDVQVDERVTLTRWSKKNRPRIPGAKGSKSLNNWKKKVPESQSSTWDVSETAKSISNAKREEAKITAWENLQKAKAEAAIRKLEMKLEKKRASSMDKIMNKLRSTQKKAQEMRSSASANQVHQVTRNTHKAFSFRTTRQMGSLTGCFTCYTF